MGVATNTQTIKPGRVRLHITPFNADLFDRIIPPSLRASASNISFHTVQTSQDKGFGYVELESMEADKLKKKFNGTTLKGMKVRMEEAKPEKKRKAKPENDNEEDLEHKARKKAKKTKAKPEDGVLLGHELEDGRHVRRGWKEDGSAGKDAKKIKKREKSTVGSKGSIDGKKLLFKTSIPPNALPVDNKKKDGSADKDKDKDKKEKKEKSRDKKENKKVVVEEGKKSTKLASVGGRSAERPAASVYQDGVGWVDASGDVLESEPESRKRKRRRASPMVERKDATSPISVAKVPDDTTDSRNEEHDASSEDEVSSVVSDTEDESEEEIQAEHEDAEMDDDIDVADDSQDAIATEPASKVAQGTKTNGTLAKDGELEVSSTPKQVHPLEALYKRPAPKQESASKPKPSPINTSFSFFNADDVDMAEDENDDNVPALPPQTPHTKQDMEWRSIRSAAPTPDTAAIGRKFSFPFANGGGLGRDEDDDDDDDEMSENGSIQDVAKPTTAAKATTGGTQSLPMEEGEKEESEYRKWFFDHRGDLNRGWKKRRREERKQKRQRENRRLSRRVV